MVEGCYFSFKVEAMWLVTYTDSACFQKQAAHGMKAEQDRSLIKY